MRSFISSLVTKLSNKALAVVAIILALLSFVIGLLTICNNAEYGSGSFINSLIMTGILCLLAFELYRGDKKKTFIFVVILLADFILTGFGGAVTDFVGARGNAVTVCRMVFLGLGLLAIFIGAALVLLSYLRSSVNKDLCVFVADCCFFAGALFLFVGGILVFCEGASGLGVANAFLADLLLAGEAVFFAFVCTPKSIEF